MDSSKIDVVSVIGVGPRCLRGGKRRLYARIGIIKDVQNRFN